MPEPQKTEEQIAEERAAAEADADAKLNAVVKSHMKRELKDIRTQLEGLKGFDPKAIEAMIGSSITKALEGRDTGDGKPRGEGGKFAADKGDPQTKVAMERLEKIQKELQDERDARRNERAASKQSAIRAQLKDLLESKGVKGARAKAAIYQLMAENVVLGDLDDEPKFKNSRSRAKGAPAEELEFDLVAGIEDWCKGSDAQDFLPAPSSKAPERRPEGGPRRQAPKYDRPAVSEQEMLRRTKEQLEARGLDVNAILNE